MTLGKLLLPITAGSDIKSSASTSFVLAARFGADVEAFYANDPPREQLIFQDEAGAPMQVQKLIAEAEKKAEAQKKNAEKEFKAVAKKHSGVTARFLAAEGAISALVAERARVADLSVIGTIPSRDNSLPDRDADIRDGAIFQSGRPVIVAPAGSASSKLGDEVVIGWKDGVEASRAVAAALPFIARAKTVRVISAGRSASKESLKALADYLSHYANSIETVVISTKKRNVAQQLMEEASKSENALLVMGAYSQWRWKEWAFGGVTDYILHETTVPVLMTH